MITYVFGGLTPFLFISKFLLFYVFNITDKYDYVNKKKEKI